MTAAMLIAVLRAASDEGGIESLSPVGQAGILGSLLVTFGIVIRVLFAAMIKSKDAEIAAANKRADDADKRAEKWAEEANKRADTAEAARDRFEQKFDHLAERTQSEVLGTLRDATVTTRQALEITRGGHDRR